LKKFPHNKKLKYAYGETQTLNEKFSHLKSWNKASGELNKTDKRIYYDYQQVLGVGGTSLHFQAEAHRLHPEAFTMKSEYGVASDWPIRYDNLEPYYNAVEKIVGVAGSGELSYRKRTEPYPLPPHELSYTSKEVKKACDKLGYTLVPNSVAILSQSYRNNVPCNYCNGCVWGCPRKDKGSTDVTFIPLALNTGNCRILTNAFAGRIEVKIVDGKKTVEGVQYFDDNGKEHFVKAKQVVVACGAVQTPRLLINSDLNENNVVGKNFMETNFYQVVAFHQNRLDAYRGIPIDSLIMDWNEPSKNKGFIGGFRLFPSAGSALTPDAYATRYFGGNGESFVKDIEEWFGHAFAIGGIGEFLPNPDTFISVHEKIKDRFELPVAKIQSFNSENELKMQNMMDKKAKEILDSCGATNIVEQFSSYDFFSSTHVFGTCKMGNKPEDSVVDSNLESHEVKNMFITDASVFPSSGGGEAPSLTIQALSLRTSAHILNERV
ncbi:MAG: GMC family oxidoreductase, partial [Candidatus Dadabacteria bacterium]|nr:GMC family oxidoreductase [Candidatus Dadabacteria bacterium]NIQ17001.1 GMC family oxidoreductase [Candidatus Dadabacteria bacterium]